MHYRSVLPNQYLIHIPENGKQKFNFHLSIHFSIFLFPMDHYIGEINRSKNVNVGGVPSVRSANEMEESTNIS